MTWKHAYNQSKKGKSPTRLYTDAIYRAQNVLDRCDTTAAVIHETMLELRKEVQQSIDNRERALLTELKQIGKIIFPPKNL
jgi:hypothetical protein